MLKVAYAFSFVLCIMSSFELAHSVKRYLIHYCVVDITLKHQAVCLIKACLVVWQSCTDKHYMRCKFTNKVKKNMGKWEANKKLILYCIIL